MNMRDLDEADLPCPKCGWRCRCEEDVDSETDEQEEMQVLSNQIFDEMLELHEATTNHERKEQCTSTT